jgi:Ca2+-dependent lipid-binding protein
MEELESISIGLFLGILVIVILNFFPGEPFDYETRHTEEAYDSQKTKEFVKNSTVQSEVERLDQIEAVASQVRIQKLQELLGMEKNKIQEMIDQAKNDVIQGRVPRKSINYSRWTDRMFYTIILSLIIVVAYRDYDFKLGGFLVYYFPREAEAVQQLIAFIGD